MIEADYLVSEIEIILDQQPLVPVIHIVLHWWQPGMETDISQDQLSSRRPAFRKWRESWSSGRHHRSHHTNSNSKLKRFNKIFLTL